MSSGFSPVTYAMSKKYTKETAAEFGAIKGASCQIQNIVHENGRNTVTFVWENTAGETRTSTMTVLDGTPIYEWQSGDYYEYGDICIYISRFYRCITPNHDIEFDDRKWNEIGSPDGNYDIVQTESLLPPIFTSADRKMYYSIEDDVFYLWDGEKWSPVKAGFVNETTEEEIEEIIMGTWSEDDTGEIDDDGTVIEEVTDEEIQELIDTIWNDD